MARHLHVGPAGHWEDTAGQSGSERVQHHLLQRLKCHSDVKVPRGLREAGLAAVRDCEFLRQFKKFRNFFVYIFFTFDKISRFFEF